MLNSLLIFIGAGVGGVCRYWIANGVYKLCGQQFPYGTLVVNATGSFLMGLLYVLILERLGGAAAQWRALVIIGFLGGYTTFSSFSMETLSLLEGGEWLNASLNIILSVVICLFLAWMGVMGAKQL